MSRRLSMFRDELQTRVLLSLSARLKDSRCSTRQENLALEETKAKIGQFERHLTNYSKTPNSVACLATRSLDANALLAEKHTAICNSLCSRSRSSIPDLLNDAESMASNHDIENAFLKAFEYKNMKVRYGKILDAYKKTFDWALIDSPITSDQPWDNLMDWLETGEGIYWIKGKAASGKSTFVKFILEQTRVKEKLNCWAAGFLLISTSFFFWNLGTALQRSQVGLLMSLLHDIFEQQRGLMKAANPMLWNKLKARTREELKALQESWHPWSLAELRCLFENLLRHPKPDLKFCLFIDGLDEFDGNHTMIAEILISLVQMSKVKICISSRPLTAFEYEFANCKGLQLQDLTVKDIRHYVHDKFQRHRRFADFSRENEQQSSFLIDEVVRASSGVFLWVHIVVKSLLDGLTNFDTIHDLLRRLRDLPQELDDLYSVMLRSIQPPFYREQTSRLLQIFYQSEGSMSALALFFAYEADTELALRAEVEPITESEAEIKVQTLSNQLKSRCKGLLEIHQWGFAEKKERFAHDEYPFHIHNVCYLHLTVKEFLEKPEVWGELLERTAKSGFDSNVACLHGAVLLLKRTLYSYAWGENTAMRVRSALSFARQAENSTAAAQVALVDEIDRLVTLINPMDRSFHWSTDFHGLHERFCITVCECTRTTMPIYAIVRGLTLYVDIKFGSVLFEINHSSAHSLLDYATGVVPLYGKKTSDHCCRGDLPNTVAINIRTGICSPSWEDLDIRPVTAMVAMLLQAGLSPNEHREDGGTNKDTPWLNLLQHLVKLSDSKTQIGFVWVDVCKLFILHGANIEAKLPVGKSKSNPCELRDVLKSVFSHLPQDKLRELEELIDERRVAHGNKYKRTKSPLRSKSRSAGYRRKRVRY